MQTTYIQIEKIDTFEFGYAIHKEFVEIIAIDHQKNYIRTIGRCTNSTNPDFLLESRIRKGFNEKGLKFQGRSGYRLQRLLDNKEAL
ncbi:hypothetical protein [Bacillus cihuensis]|uniref:hypothetical protein n=1 Tax=Bacillus cihuensis TaxID=1208599 RepID=UPI000409EDBD|nr:hypothetical protein [Bacillus cihuensis]